MYSPTGELLAKVCPERGLSQNTWTACCMLSAKPTLNLSCICAVPDSLVCSDLSSMFSMVALNYLFALCHPRFKIDLHSLLIYLPKYSVKKAALHPNIRAGYVHILEPVKRSFTAIKFKKVLHTDLSSFLHFFYFLLVSLGCCISQGFQQKIIE